MFWVLFYECLSYLRSCDRDACLRRASTRSTRGHTSQHSSSLEGRRVLRRRIDGRQARPLLERRRTSKDRPELSLFSRVYKACAFFKYRLWCIAIFRRGRSQTQHFQSSLLVQREGGHKTEYSVYALDNVDNSGRPLSSDVIIMFSHLS